MIEQTLGMSQGADRLKKSQDRGRPEYRFTERRQEDDQPDSADRVPDNGKDQTERQNEHNKMPESHRNRFP
jgi:hypothetical protein